MPTQPLVAFYRRTDRKKREDFVHDLCLAHLDGSGERTIAREVFFGLPVQWLGASDRLLYQVPLYDGGGLFVADIESGSVQAVETRFARVFEWAVSPGGHRVAYMAQWVEGQASVRGGNLRYALGCVDLATGNERVLEGPGPSRHRLPSWLDDETLAYYDDSRRLLCLADVATGTTRRLPLPFAVSYWRHSPNGRSLGLIRDGLGGGLYLATPDVSQVWELRGGQPFDFCWSWASTAVAAWFYDSDDSGLYVIDVTSGAQRRIATDGYTSPRCFLHDDQSLLTNDGATISVVDAPAVWTIPGINPMVQPLAVTDDARPAGIEPEVRPEFSWAEQVYDRAATEHERATSDQRAVAVWAELRADPDAGPPFEVRIGIATTDSTSTAARQIASVEGCESIPDAIARLRTRLEALNLATAPSFSLIYPRYATSPERETLAIHIAHLIRAAADEQGWGFDREPGE